MQMLPRTKPCRILGISALSLLVWVAQATHSQAIDPAKSGQQRRSDAQLPDGGASQRGFDELPQSERRRDEGTQDERTRGGLGRDDLDRDGARMIHPPHRQRWYLGVRVWYTDKGARVTGVFPNTPAWRVGLEPRDQIVSIDGYQIGHVNRRFYEISRELNLRAGRTGWVRLLVQNCRNDQLVNVDVQLADLGGRFPRDRFGLSPGMQFDQADEAEPEETPR